MQFWSRFFWGFFVLALAAMLLVPALLWSELLYKGVPKTSLERPSNEPQNLVLTDEPPDMSSVAQASPVLQLELIPKLLQFRQSVTNSTLDLNFETSGSFSNSIVPLCSGCEQDVEYAAFGGTFPTRTGAIGDTITIFLDFSGNPPWPGVPSSQASFRINPNTLEVNQVAAPSTFPGCSQITCEGFDCRFTTCVLGTLGETDQFHLDFEIVLTCSAATTLACTVNAGPAPCDAAPGTRTCSPSSVGFCVMTADFTPELGNGLDDDCDMVFDECNPGQTSLPCTANVGSPNCALAPGTAPCGGGACAAVPDLVPEIANGVDDDGDCTVDECNPGQTTIACTTPLRTCAAWPGAATCNGAVPGVCLPSAADLGNPAVCPKFVCSGGNTVLDSDGDGNPDNDGDGLPDCWETEGGIDVDADGTIDFPLVAANPNHKNLYIELDYMSFHQPQGASIASIVAAFAAAPQVDVRNPDGLPGITLTIEVDDLLLDGAGNPLHTTQMAFQSPFATPGVLSGCSTVPPRAGASDFDVLKTQWFGNAAERTGLPLGLSGRPLAVEAKELVYRYVIFAHDLENDLLGNPQTTSGCAETWGNDFVVSLGTTWGIHDAAGNLCPVPGVGGVPVVGASSCVDQEAGTLMHELGHTLNLRHGGSDGINCKPNYPSVMSWGYQINNQFVGASPPRYSSGLNTTLNEAMLAESFGLGPTVQAGVTMYGPAPGTALAWNVQASVPIPDPVAPAMTPALCVPPQCLDWDIDGVLTAGTVGRDINFWGSCPANVDADMDGLSDPEVLNDFNDWANLQYDFTTTPNFLDGVRSDLPQELSVSPLLGPDTDGDGLVNILDNCVLEPNHDQADRDGDGVGDACLIVPVAECVHQVGPSEYVALFGYRNPLRGGIFIDHGLSNGFSPPPVERGQTVHFGHGTVRHAFHVPFNGAPIAWRLGGLHAVAAADLPMCSGDEDGDGVINLEDNCVFTPNLDQADSNSDSGGDACPESCEDGLVNQGESDFDCGGPCGATCFDGELCVTAADCAGETCTDGLCEGDQDADGVLDSDDNCLAVSNPFQEDFDADGLGDACDDDLDDDGRSNDADNCPVVANPAQLDFDTDGLGDACDSNSLVADAGPDQINECSGNGKASVTLDGTGSGAPSGSLSYKWTATVTLSNSTQSVATGNFPVGTRTATLKVSQGSVFKTDSTLITVLDTTAPSLTVPADVVAQTCVGVSIGQATAVDTCGGSVTIVHDAPSSFKAGVTVVTWHAIDQYGNVVGKTQKVTVGLGDNAACCPSGSNVIVGTSNNDTLNGTSGRDCILGKGAQDAIKGFGGNDLLSGGDGDDIIEGGDGDDLLQGGSGQDTLRGQNGVDWIFGGDGDDQCWGGNQDDTLYGGQGQDNLYGEANNDALYGDDGDDRLEGGAGNDALSGGGLHDLCLGGSGNNTFTSCEQVQ